MKQNKLIVIGGNAAGMSAASKLRRLDADREIIVFEKGSITSYAACGIPYFIAGMVDSADEMIARTPEVFRKKQQIDVRIHHEVIEIDINNKRVKVINPENNNAFWESYDDLLISTGASPIVPALKGSDAKGVFALASLESGSKVREYVKSRQPENAVIVGGGYIGIEMAEALLMQKIDVTLIDMAPQVMTTMDAEMAELISSYMKDEGVNVHLNEKLEAIETDDNGCVKAVVTGNRTLPAGLVILGVGIKPNSGLAKEAGIALGVNNAIGVNKKLETSAPNVWAAGDCAESFHLISKKQTYVALGTVANKHGLVAGNNIFGNSQDFPGVLGTAITKFNALEISLTGLTEKQAKENGFHCKAAMISSTTASGYYPASGKITVKLIAENESNRLLGGQITGMPGSGKRIDTIAACITAGLTARDLAFMDLSYAPPFSQPWDPVQIAARQLL
jgi:NADPH-dependent 2,4-dienoyl-CoA reductase/sulfur reductase-like enzyme